TFVIWTCRGKNEKGMEFCDSKNVPQEALIASCCRVLGLSEFDEDVFLEQVDHITVYKDNLLVFHLTDGTEVSDTWEFHSTAKKDWWTPERKKEWGDRHKNKDTNPNRKHFYEFTGFIKCGCCGANYRCQGVTGANGRKWRYWHCTGPRTECQNPTIKDETMKRLVADVLGLSEFDEAVMDAQMDYATILDHTVTFHFRDGHTESRDYLDRKVGTPWTEERRVKQTKAIREGRRWRRDAEESDNDTGDAGQVHGGTD
ncbi:MAG: zinc ribbon domain-containing protein, partial [Clostridia bacterium]|nr:zinc ribbon domain-containing protein [Clostridia bacterium]